MIPRRCPVCLGLGTQELDPDGNVWAVDPDEDERLCWDEVRCMTRALHVERRKFPRDI